MRRFGNRATFAIEVGGLPAYVVEAGETQASDVRVVDVWAGGNWLTCHDNAAYVPTYTWLDDLLVIAGRIRRPSRTEVFVARVPPDEFVAIVNGAVDLLDGRVGPGTIPRWE